MKKFLLLAIAFVACNTGIDTYVLQGKWKYIRVGVPNSSPPDTVTRAELEEKTPTIEFKSNNTFEIIWGGQVLSHGSYAPSGKNLKLTEQMPDGKTREFQFYISELTRKKITFETTGQGGSRVTAVKE